ncbi:MAG: S8 family serine peptidase [Clostridia bacterium]|nr:S8 family serine peptidase [Clostridia bacterium]
MKWYKRSLLKVFLGTFLLSQILPGGIILPVKAQENPFIDNVEGREKEILVKYKDDGRVGMSSIEEKLAGSDIEIDRNVRIADTELVELNKKEDMEKALEELQKDPDIQYVQPNFKLNYNVLAEDILDTRFSEQWGIYNSGGVINGQAGIVRLDANIIKAWDITAGDPEVVIGVIDTGTDISHPDLVNNIYRNPGEIEGDGIDNDGNGYVDDMTGWDFADENNSVFDSFEEDYHGTHVSGIIAAGSNGIGIRGVAPNVKVMPLKFIEGSSGGYTSDAIEAIQYAKQLGVKIVNCSWGSAGYNPALEDAMRNAEMLFICAAGNEGINLSITSYYPSGFTLPNVLSVAAVDNKGELASFSNYGNKVQIAAPGVGIMSTLPENRYGFLNGTSMAAPFVTGTAALLKSQNVVLTPEQIKERVMGSVTKLQDLSGKVITGGMLDAYASLIGYVPPEGAPGAPTGVKLVSKDDKAAVTWSEVLGAQRYEVERDKEISGSVTGAVYNYGGISSLETHIYRVRAVNENGAGMWSTAATEMINLGIPSNLNAEKQDRSITLNWDPVNGALGYDLLMDGIVMQNVSSPYTHEGLEPNTQHSYQVRAKCGSILGEWSGEVETYTSGGPMIWAEVSNYNEGAEHLGKVIIHLMKGSFKEEGLYDPSTVTLNEEDMPSGVTQGNVIRLDSSTLEISLQGDSTVDYDTDRLVSVTVQKAIIDNAFFYHPACSALFPAIVETQPAAPSISFSLDGLDAGKLMGVNSQMEYSLNGGSVYQSVLESDMALSASQINALTPQNDIWIREKTTLRVPAGLIQIIDLQDGAVLMNVLRDDTLNTVSGVDGTMEFSLDGGVSWTRYDDNLPDLSGNITLKVRKAACGLILPGNPATLIFTQNESYEMPPSILMGLPGNSEYNEDQGIITPTPAITPTPLSQITPVADLTVSVSLSPVNIPLSTPVPQGQQALDAKSKGEHFIEERIMVKEKEVEGAKALFEVNEWDMERILNSDGAKVPSIMAKSQKDLGAMEIRIPGTSIHKAAEKNRAFKIEFTDIGFEVQPEILDFTTLKGDLKLSVEKTSVPEREVEKSIKAQVFREVTHVFDLNVMMGDQRITKFIKPIQVTFEFKTSSVRDVNKLGVYYFNEDRNEWEYVGGKVNGDGKITFLAEHFSKYTVMEYSKTFQDIKTHWAKQAIEVMAARHIAKGKDESNFNPDGYITRAEFVSLLVRALDIKESAAKHKFLDVAEGVWYGDAIYKAYKAGIIGGIDSLHFAPNDKITREQMAVIAMKTYGYYLNMKPEEMTVINRVEYKDKNLASRWSLQSMKFTGSMGLLSGNPDGTFAPKAYSTRAQAVVVIKRLMEKLGVV